MIKFEIVSYKEFRKHFPENAEDKVVMEAYESIKLPERSTKNSAGYDFFVHSNFVAKNGVYATGIKARMDDDTVLLLMPRSSLGFKNGFRMLNTIGVIDSDYYNNQSNEGHILVGFDTDKPLTLKTGDKLCQGIFVNYKLTDNDNSHNQRIGGIGSTGN